MFSAIELWPSAATARRHNLTIVTGNDRDFRRPGLKVFNPFEEDAQKG
jgi:predicted nucleic acid-binding protein